MGEGGSPSGASQPDGRPELPQWLDWAQRLAAVAQTGLSYADSPFDEQRYATVREVAAEMIAHSSGRDVEAVRTALSGDRGYATPKIDVRGVVVDEQGRVLLVRERSDGRWTLPGGFADVGEGPRLAVEREVREESGYEVRARRLLAVLDRHAWPHPPALHQVWKFLIACDLVGGEPLESIETDGVSFCPADALPELSTIRILPQQIALALERFVDPAAPAYLD